MSIEQDVRAFIATNYMFSAEPAELDGNASLTSSGVVDSMGVLELILFLEERFGFSVGDDEALPENLDSVNSIVAYVRRKRAPVEAVVAASDA